MKRGHLRDCFAGVGVKRLSAVDADPRRSNQHEIGTTTEMRNGFLGTEHQKRFEVRYVLLGEEGLGLSLDGTATHYDARINQSKRSAEWRLYYPANAITETMQEGDTLVLAMSQDGHLWFIVARSGSLAERQLCWLFSVAPPQAGKCFVTQDLAHDTRELDYVARHILDEYGIPFVEPDADRLDALIEPYETAFPKTREFAELARKSLPEVNPRDDADGAMLAWIEREEALFRRLERRSLAGRLREGFMVDDAVDVNGFVSYSLSVLNRRKSRMGLSLEHHAAAVFDAWNISFARQVVTERNNKPDFLFPSAEAYHSGTVGDPGLMMLGVKSTCKERWRQILPEADKIPLKHLLTLESGISGRQTEQMRVVRLQLVIPLSIHETYSESQQKWLWSLSEFIEEARRRQSLFG